MRLSELDPRWITFHGWASDSVFCIGLTFQCPHCRSQRLGVLFDQPIDPDHVAATFGVAYDSTAFGAGLGMKAWTRTGDTFETLTLTPSINTAEAGHWHGFISNGEIQ